MQAKLGQLIDDLGLSVRTVNSLKNSSIRTLKDLVEYSERDLLDVKNVGEKAVAEIGELLVRESLRFGMGFEEVGGELRGQLIDLDVDGLTAEGEDLILDLAAPGGGGGLQHFSSDTNLVDHLRFLFSWYYVD